MIDYVSLAVNCLKLAKRVGSWIWDHKALFTLILVLLAFLCFVIYHASVVNILKSDLKTAVTEKDLAVADAAAARSAFSTQQESISKLKADWTDCKSMQEKQSQQCATLLELTEKRCANRKKIEDIVRENSKSGKYDAEELVKAYNDLVEKAKQSTGKPAGGAK